MDTDKLKKDFGKAQGMIYAYGNRFKKNGSLNYQEVAVLSKCAERVLKLGGYTDYRYAQQILTDNKERLV